MESTFGKKLAALHEARGYSQFQLGRLLGVTDKAVSKWETGKARPRQTACARLAALLGVDAGLLLDDDSLTKEESDRLLEERKDLLWDACEKRMAEIYGPMPPLEVQNRFIIEKNALYRTHAIILFDMLSRVKEAARSKKRTLHGFRRDRQMLYRVARGRLRRQSAGSPRILPRMP